MKIRYVWIDLFGNIARQGFNFDMKYRFDFDFKSRTLSINKTGFDPETFFPKNISDVSLIVGENGSGKTTLMEFLTRHLDSTFAKSIVVVGKRVFFHPELQQIELAGDAKTEFKIFNNDLIEDRAEFRLLLNRHLKVLTFSNGFSERVAWKSNYATDMTLGSYLRKDAIEDKSNLGFLEKYKLAELRRAISFLDRAESNNDGIVLPFAPDSINKLKCAFRPPGDNRIQETLKHYLEVYRLMASRILKVFSRGDIRMLNRFEARMVASDAIREYCFAIVVMNLLSTGAEYKGNRDKLNAGQDHGEFYGEIIKNLEFPGSKFLHSEAVTNAFFEVLGALAESAHLDFRPSNSYLPNREDTLLQFLFRTQAILVINRPDAGEFLRLYEAMIIQEPFISFYWGLSSGERAFLSMFSRFWEKHEDIISRGNILVLLDEGELHFHPEWQRKYVNYLLTYLPNIFNQASSIQIILTSHSPFVISDLPDSNVVYVRRNRAGFMQVLGIELERKTFAANIHHLFADSFFLQGALVGEFAKQKVNGLIDYLNERSPNPFEMEHNRMVLNLIGDPYIRRRLSSMWREKFNENPDDSEQ